MLNRQEKIQIQHITCTAEKMGAQLKEYHLKVLYYSLKNAQRDTQIYMSK